MILTRWGLLESDFQRFYGQDLRVEVFVNRVGVRRLYALVVGLPEDAAVWRKERERANEWTRQDELLARSIEVSSMWFHILARLAGPKNPDQLPKPEQVPRPEWLAPKAQKRKVETDPAVIAAFFRQRHG